MIYEKIVNHTAFPEQNSIIDPVYRRIGYDRDKKQKKRWKKSNKYKKNFNHTTAKKR